LKNVFKFKNLNVAILKHLSCLRYLLGPLPLYLITIVLKETIILAKKVYKLPQYLDSF